MLVLFRCGLYRMTCQNSGGRSGGGGGGGELEIFLLGSQTWLPFNNVKGAVDGFYIVFSLSHTILCH